MTSLLAVHQGGGFGGAPVSLVKLLAALDRSWLKPSAIFTEPGAVVEYARHSGVSASVVPTRGAFFYSAHAHLGPRMLAGFIRTFPSSVKLAQHVLRERRPDVLHLNTSVLLAWAAAARRERVPVVWVVREVLGPHPAVRRWHVRFLQRHARQLVTISDAVTACFPPDANVRRVYNAVDLREFRLELLAGAPATRAALGLTDADQVVIMLGSVQRAKGHWLVLDALQHPRLRHAHLLLVTGGVGADYSISVRGRVKRALNLPLDNLDALLRLARQRQVDRRLHVTGFLRPDDVIRMLAASDVLVFPSLAPEGFGRPIIEAMAMARPVVATDLGPSRELLGHDAGRLVPPVAGALAHALGDLLADPDERARMGRAGRARVEACFGLERQVAEMSAIYAEATQIPFAPRGGEG